MSRPAHHRRRTPLLLAAVAAASLSTAVLGQVSGTWTGLGGDSLWSNTANWTSHPQFPGNGGTATFVTNVGSSLDVDTTLSALFLGATTTVGGSGSLTLTGPAIIHSAHPGIWNPRYPFDTATEGATINSSILGSAGLHKTGPGAIRLTRPNSFTGPMLVSGGTLSFEVSLGAIGNPSTITLDGGALRGAGTTASRPMILGSGGGTLVNGGAYHGVISGPGALTMRSTTPMSFTAANTFTGAFTTTGEGSFYAVLRDNGALATNTINIAGTGLVLDNSAVQNANRIPTPPR